MYVMMSDAFIIFLPDIGGEEMGKAGVEVLRDIILDPESPDRNLNASTCGSSASGPLPLHQLLYAKKYNSGNLFSAHHLEKFLYQ